ncbi:uncharacterized protein SAPINGB_P006012 [Magnusiomyces paraingens]|uniref:UDENN domain-containing protein n=1 Tax=Magnusiomyces paraingens TaxID=2606893 RepID=A0A5E8C4T7_9ASCO|nr:uncharacterized protein SAPINGB_P006012 [Saprochaete ingens]VVT58050.1 unnamed protein product [Saprochaete ingens]
MTMLSNQSSTDPPIDMTGSLSSSSASSSDHSSISASGTDSFVSSLTSSIPHTPITPTTPMIPQHPQAQQQQLGLSRKPPMLYSPAKSLEAPPIPPRSPGRVNSTTQIRLLDRDKRYSTTSAATVPPSPILSSSGTTTPGSASSDSKMLKLQQQLAALQEQAQAQIEDDTEAPPSIDSTILDDNNHSASVASDAASAAALQSASSLSLAEQQPHHPPLTALSSPSLSSLQPPPTEAPTVPTSAAAAAAAVPTATSSSARPVTSPLSITYHQTKRPPPLEPIPQTAPLAPTLHSAPPALITRHHSILSPVTPLEIGHSSSESSSPAPPTPPMQTHTTIPPVAPLSIHSSSTPPTLPPKSQHRSPSLRLLRSSNSSTALSSPATPKTPLSLNSPSNNPNSTHGSSLKTAAAGLGKWAVAIALVTHNNSADSLPVIKSLLPEESSFFSFSKDDTQIISSCALPEPTPNLDCTVTNFFSKQAAANLEGPSISSCTSQFHSFRFEPSPTTVIPSSRFASAKSPWVPSSQPFFPITLASSSSLAADRSLDTNNQTSTKRPDIYGFVLASTTVTNEGVVFQDSIVILSRLNYPQLFNACLQVIYDVAGRPNNDFSRDDEYKLHIINSAISDMTTWPDPKPNSTLELGFLGTIFTVSIPHHESVPLLGTVDLDSSSAHFHSMGRNTHKLYSLSTNFSTNNISTKKQPKPTAYASTSNLTSTESMLDTKTAVPADAPVITASEPSGTWDYIINYISDIADIYLIYEYVLLGKPIVVYGNSPHLVSTFISLILDLIRPIPYGGRVREYVTPQCAPLDFESGITGITSPFLLESIFGISMDSVGNMNTSGICHSTTSKLSISRNKNILLFVLSPNAKLIASQKHAAKLATAISIGSGSASNNNYNLALSKQHITSPYFYYRTFHSGVGILRRQNNIWTSFANFVIISSPTIPPTITADTASTAHRQNYQTVANKHTSSPTTSPKKAHPTSTPSASSNPNGNGLINKFFSKFGLSKRQSVVSPSSRSTPSPNTSTKSHNSSTNSSYKTVPVTNSTTAGSSQGKNTPIVTILEERPRTASGFHTSHASSNNATLKIQQHNFQQQFQESASQLKNKQQEELNITARAAMRRSITHITKNGRLLIPESKFVAQITQMSASALQLAIPKTIEYVMAVRESKTGTISPDEIAKILGTPKTIDFAIRFHFATLTSRFLAPLSCFLEPKIEIGDRNTINGGLSPIMSNVAASSSAFNLTSSSGNNLVIPHQGSRRMSMELSNSSRRVSSGRSPLNTGTNSDLESDSEYIGRSNKPRVTSSSSTATITSFSASTDKANKSTSNGSTVANSNASSTVSAPLLNSTPSKPSSSSRHVNGTTQPNAPTLAAPPVLHSSQGITPPKERKKFGKLVKSSSVGQSASTTNLTQSMYNLTLPTINGSASNVAQSSKRSGKPSQKAKAGKKPNGTGSHTSDGSPGTPQKPKRYSLPPTLTLTLNNLDDDEDYFADLQSFYTPTSGPGSSTTSPHAQSMSSGSAEKEKAHHSFFSSRRLSSHSRNSSGSSSKGSPSNSKTTPSVFVQPPPPAPSTSSHFSSGPGSHAVSLLRSLSGRSTSRKSSSGDSKHKHSSSGDGNSIPSMITNSPRGSVISSVVPGSGATLMDDSRRASSGSKRISLRRVSSIFDSSTSSHTDRDEDKGFDISSALPVTTFGTSVDNSDSTLSHHHGTAGNGEELDDFKKQEIYKEFMNNVNFANWLKMTHAEVYN